MPGIISGRAWLAQRHAFLTEELAKDPPDEQRAALEAELAALEPQLAASRRRWWRWLLLGSRPPN